MSLSSKGRKRIVALRRILVFSMMVIVFFLVLMSIVYMLLPLNSQSVEGTYIFNHEVNPWIEQGNDTYYLRENGGSTHGLGDEHGQIDHELASVNNEYLREVAIFMAWADLKTNTVIEMMIWDAYVDGTAIPLIGRLDLTPYLKRLEYEGFTEGNCTITRGIAILMYVGVPGLPQTEIRTGHIVLAKVHFTLRNGNITSVSVEETPLEITEKVRLYDPRLINLKNLAPYMLLTAVIIETPTLLVSRRNHPL